MVWYGVLYTRRTKTSLHAGYGRETSSHNSCTPSPLFESSLTKTLVANGLLNLQMLRILQTQRRRSLSSPTVRPDIQLADSSSPDSDVMYIRVPRTCSQGPGSSPLSISEYKQVTTAYAGTVLDLDVVKNHQFSSLHIYLQVFLNHARRYLPSQPLSVESRIIA